VNRSANSGKLARVCGGVYEQSREAFQAPYISKEPKLKPVRGVLKDQIVISCEKMGVIVRADKSAPQV
jgi:hypothetical protein